MLIRVSLTQMWLVRVWNC